MTVLYIILALLVLFLAVILIRAAAFKPKSDTRAEPDTVELDGQKAIDDLASMIRCKTVSYYDLSLEDDAEFDKFRALLPKLFPHVFEKCSFERIDRTGLLLKWKGVSDAEPTVLMAHYDVVPVNEDQWDKPAFEGVIESGVLWGRGTLDTKGTLNGVLQAAENLIAKGFVPKNDIYLSFSGDEEIAGPGAPAIVAELEKRGIKPQLVVDEGGAVVEDIFPGVSQPCALVGIAEKGMMDVGLVIRSKGGHASSPPPHTPVGLLSKAAVDIENHPFSMKISPAVAQMFDTLGRHSSFAYRLIFSNLWCFKPLLNAICKKTGGELNALVRTTVALTQMEGSKASNVLPPSAKMVANLRMAEGDTMDSAVAYLQNIAGPDITVSRIQGMNPSICSDTDSEAWRNVKSAIERTWPEALVSPYLMIACSDSRHFCRISDKVMRFSAMALTKEERGMIHANNERIPTDKIVKTVEFYIRLIKQR